MTGAMGYTCPHRWAFDCPTPEKDCADCDVFWQDADRKDDD